MSTKTASILPESSQYAADYLAEASDRLRTLRHEVAQTESNCRRAILELFGPDLGQYVTVAEAITILARRDRASSARQ